MAPVNSSPTIDSNDEKSTKKSAKHDMRGEKDLEKVTDYAEEKEMNQQDVSGAMSRIGAIAMKESDTAAKQQALAKVAIKKEDIELIMKELEVSKMEADLKLREHNGNVVEALTALIN